MAKKTITKCTLLRIDPNNTGHFQVRLNDGTEFGQNIDLSDAPDLAAAKRIIRKTIARIVANAKVKQAPKQLDLAPLLNQDIPDVVTAEIDDDTGVSTVDEAADRQKVKDKGGANP